MEDDAPPAPSGAGQLTEKIAAVSLVACAAAAVAGTGGEWHWLLELCCHVTLLLIAVTAALLLLLCWRRRWKWSLLAAATLGLLAFRAAPREFGDRVKDPADDAASVRLVVANVLSGSQGYEPLLQFVRRCDPDLLVILELTPSGLQQLEPGLGGFPHHELVLRNDSFGIGIFSRRPLLQAQTVLFDSDFPSLLAQVDVDGRAMQLIATHTLTPVSRQRAALRNEQFDELAMLAAQSPIPVAVVGDLNCTPWSPFFTRLLNKGGLRDSRIGFGVQPTWPAQLPWLMRIPIDHVLLSDAWSVSRREVGPLYASDHLPVFVEFRLRQ